MDTSVYNINEAWEFMIKNMKSVLKKYPNLNTQEYWNQIKHNFKSIKNLYNSNLKWTNFNNDINEEYFNNINSIKKKDVNFKKIMALGANVGKLRSNKNQIDYKLYKKLKKNHIYDLNTYIDDNNLSNAVSAIN